MWSCQSIAASWGLLIDVIWARRSKSFTLEISKLCVQSCTIWGLIKKKKRTTLQCVINLKLCKCCYWIGSLFCIALLLFDILIHPIPSPNPIKATYILSPGLFSNICDKYCMFQYCRQQKKSNCAAQANTEYLTMSFKTKEDCLQWHQHSDISCLMVIPCVGYASNNISAYSEGI